MAGIPTGLRSTLSHLGHANSVILTPMSSHGFRSSPARDYPQRQRHRRHDHSSPRSRSGNRIHSRESADTAESRSEGRAAGAAESIACSPRPPHGFVKSFPARHELTQPRRMRHPERSEGSLFKSRTWFLLRTPVHANLAAIQDRAAQNLGAALLLRFVVTIER